MKVVKIDSRIRDCFGKSDRNFIATNDGTVQSGCAYGKTEQEAITNLKAENVREGLRAIATFEHNYPAYGNSAIQNLSALLSR